MARNLFEICKSKVISDSGSIFTHIGRRTPVRPFYGLLLFCFCYDQMWTSDDPNRVHLKHLEKHRMFEQIPFIKPVILLISYFQISLLVSSNLMKIKMQLIATVGTKMKMFWKDGRVHGRIQWAGNKHWDPPCTDFAGQIRKQHFRREIQTQLISSPFELSLNSEHRLTTASLWFIDYEPWSTIVGHRLTRRLTPASMNPDSESGCFWVSK